MRVGRRCGRPVSVTDACLRVDPHPPDPHRVPLRCWPAARRRRHTARPQTCLVARPTRLVRRRGRQGPPAGRRAEQSEPGRQNLTQSGPNWLVTAGFVPYAGDGYALLLPGKWNPSKEREFAGMDVRCAAARELQPPPAGLVN